MPRYDDKITAFNRSITREPSGRKIVRTSLFVRNLASLNYELSLDEANRWIRLNARLPVRQGDVLLASLDGRSYFGKILGQAFITHDGDAIEGECLDELQVIGVVTHFVTDMCGGLDDDCPVI